MENNFIKCLETSDVDLIEPNESLLTILLKQYGSVVLHSLITAFGLDMFITDRYGGDVDTVHNVRQIGTDPKMKYKNEKNQQAYETRPEYKSYDYHGGNKNYRDTISEAKRKLNENGELIKDGYTGKDIVYTTNKNAPNSIKAQQDHAVSSKSIHDDRGAVLSGLNGTDLANDPINLVFTNAALNNNMRDKSIPEYLEWCDQHPDQVNWNGVAGQPIPDEVKAELLRRYNEAKKEIDKKINTAYYTSARFWDDALKAATKRGFQMGLRQALGFVFMELWFAALDELEKVKEQKDISIKFKAVAKGISKGFENAKKKYRKIFEEFVKGGISGILSSLVTTLINAFTTLDETQVRMIRQIGPSLVEASKILFINPDNYLLGQRVKETTKIIATGASVLVGTGITESVNAALIEVPFFTEKVTLRKIISNFCGALVSGLMSCTILFILDYSEVVNLYFEFLDGVQLIEQEINYYREQALLFEQYAAQLMQLDCNELQKRIKIYSSLTEKLETAENETEYNSLLLTTVKELGIKLPWNNHSSFDDFMKDNNAVLVFE